MVTRLPWGMVNAYLVRGHGGDILVDTGLPGSLGYLLWMLRRHGSSPERLKLILITHVHFDHVGNLAALKRLTAAPVLVHRAEAPLLAEGRVVLPAGQTRLARTLMAVGGVAARTARLGCCTADIVVDDTVNLSEFSLAGQVLHTPGHTAGSLSLVLEGGDAVVGDLCQYGFGFGMGLGRVLPPLADLPGAVPGSFRRVLGAGARRVYPGHGVDFDAQEMAACL